MTVMVMMVMGGDSVGDCGGWRCWLTCEWR